MSLIEARETSVSLVSFANRYLASGTIEPTYVSNVRSSKANSCSLGALISAQLPEFESTRLFKSPCLFLIVSEKSSFWLRFV
jgi:hypothetical protein